MYIINLSTNLFTNFTICDHHFLCDYGNMPVLALDIVKVNGSKSLLVNVLQFLYTVSFESFITSVIKVASSATVHQ